MPDHHREKWINLYQSAMLELETSLLAGRIAEARAEIVKRIEALRGIPGLHEGEQQAIEDALNNLRVLDREAAAEDQTEIARTALERLRSIAPRIKMPDQK